MYSIFTKLAPALIALFVLFAACKKPTIPPGPGPNNPVPTSSRYVQFTVDQLPGEGTIVTGLKARISIINEQSQAVLDTLLEIKYDGKYLTDSFQLPFGSYKLSKFLVTGQGNATRFASPVANSPRATMVQQPLHISFSLPKPATARIPLEVLRIGTGDQPQEYGYPEGSFNAGPGDPVSTVKVFIQPLIKIGDVIYDSVPVSFTLTSWDANGQMTVKNSTLLPGKTQLELSKTVTKYQFKVMKWGTTDEMTLTQNDLQEGTVYSLGGSKAAKRLLSEISYIQVDGKFKAESKKQYEYGAENKILSIVHQRKRADNTVYVSLTEKFTYTNNQVTRIIQYDEHNAVQAATTFTYFNDGKVSSIIHNEGGAETRGTVDYTSFQGGTGISGYHGIHVEYIYSNHYYTMNYSKSFIGGTMVEDAAITSHHSSELGRYAYDFKINPYIHLKIPDLFLTHTSKHNKVYEQKTYYAHYPLVVPYAFEYTYDSDDYPKELVTKYRNYGSTAHVQTTKIVYNYVV